MKLSRRFLSVSVASAALFAPRVIVPFAAGLEIQKQ